MARISGLSRLMVCTGVHELDDPPDPHGRVRRPGWWAQAADSAPAGLLSANRAASPHEELSHDRS
jgi:hypothetical protein